MAKVNKWITARKAIVRGLQYAGVAVIALQAVPVPADIGVSRQVAITFGLAAAGAVAKAIQNYRKTKARPVRYMSPSGLVLAVAGLSLVLSGCVTTTAPDGATTTQVDGALLETALTRYDRHVARRDLLKAERERAREARDAQRLAIVEAEIDKLEPEIARLAARLGL